MDNDSWESNTNPDPQGNIYDRTHDKCTGPDHKIRRLNKNRLKNKVRKIKSTKLKTSVHGKPSNEKYWSQEHENNPAKKIDAQGKKLKQLNKMFSITTNRSTSDGKYVSANDNIDAFFKELNEIKRVTRIPSIVGLVGEHMNIKQKVRNVKEFNHDDRVQKFSDKDKPNPKFISHVRM